MRHLPEKEVLYVPLVSLSQKLRVGLGVSECISRRYDGARLVNV